MKFFNKQVPAKPKSNNADFYDDLYFTYHNYIYCIIEKIVYSQNYADAEDLCQEVFFLAMKNIDTLRTHPNIKSWLVITAKNLTMNFNKCKLISQKYINPAERDFDTLLATDEVEHEVFEKIQWEQYINDQIVEEVKSILSEAELQLFHLKFERKLKNDKIAEEMNISPANVNTRSLRIKNKMKEYIRTKYK